MGLIKDFKEFLRLKNEKEHSTSELYVGDLGTSNVWRESTGKMFLSRVYARFTHDRYVIMKKANPSEIKHYLKDKYGYYHIPEFERPGNSEFYKILTMNNKVVPHASTRLMCNDTDNEGTHEVINSARSLNGLKNKGIRFADVISQSDIVDLEDIINQTPDFSM